MRVISTCDVSVGATLRVQAAKDARDKSTTSHEICGEFLIHVGKNMNLIVHNGDKEEINASASPGPGFSLPIVHRQQVFIVQGIGEKHKPCFCRFFGG
jgi:hypothetical protein